MRREALKLQWPVPTTRWISSRAARRNITARPAELLGGCQRSRPVAHRGLVPVQGTSQMRGSLLFLSDRWMAAFRS